MLDSTLSLLFDTTPPCPRLEMFEILFSDQVSTRDPGVNVSCATYLYDHTILVANEQKEAEKPQSTRLT